MNHAAFFAQETASRLEKPLESARCACERGSTCDVSHDPATCPCMQCISAERASTAKVIRNLLRAT